MGGEPLPQLLLPLSPLLTTIERLELSFAACRNAPDWRDRFGAICEMHNLKELHLTFPQNCLLLPSSFICLLPILPRSLHLVVVRPVLSVFEVIEGWEDLIARMLDQSSSRLRFVVRIKPARFCQNAQVEVTNARDVFGDLAKSPALQPFKDNGRLSLRWQLGEPEPSV